MFDAPTREMHSLEGFQHFMAYISDHINAESLKVKFELTSVVVDNVLAMWVMAKPGPVYYSSCCR